MESLFQNRRTFLASIGGSLPALLAATRKRTTAPPANIVLIIADEVPAQQLSCYGNRDAKTPHIDALARRGVRFQNAFASGRGGPGGLGTLLTGRTVNQRPGAGDVFITDLLAAKGYDVGFVGVWGFGDERKPGHGIRWAYTVAGEQMYANGEPAAEVGDVSGILAQRAGQFLDQQTPAAKPFFLALSNPPTAGVAALDAQVQSVVAKLKQRGLEENTMVVFTAAGGAAESPRSPLIFCWPGHAPVEATRPDMIGQYDLMFTMCGAADVVAPAARNLCGRSYLPLVEGKPFPKKSPWRSVVYGSFGEKGDMASDNRFQLTVFNDVKGPGPTA